jgi:putative phosphoribosyl transferase
MPRTDPMPSAIEENVRIETRNGPLGGTLVFPDASRGVVVFAHGSGSSRHSPRNQFVARQLQQRGHGTLLMDLLTPSEEEVDVATAEYRFDVQLLAQRLSTATDWLANNHATRDCQVGYFGASTGAAAALVAAAHRMGVAAIVSRGGRPDLAGGALRLVTAPTLLIVGDQDHAVIQLNRAARRQLERCERKELHLIPGATHLFEEPGALEEVARLAGQWFDQYLSGPTAGDAFTH